MSDPDAWETKCPKSDDGFHCEHWYDGEACHACGDPPDPNVVDGEFIPPNTPAPEGDEPDTGHGHGEYDDKH